jgi:hypothetical protein
VIGYFPWTFIRVAIGIGRVSKPRCSYVGEKGHIGEGRLTAAWFNIMAAGLVAAGTMPFLTGVALEGWTARTRALMLVSLCAVASSTLLHLLGRFVGREIASGEQEAKTALSISTAAHDLHQEKVRFLARRMSTPCSGILGMMHAQPSERCFMISTLSPPIMKSSSRKFACDGQRQRRLMYAQTESYRNADVA